MYLGGGAKRVGVGGVVLKYFGVSNDELLMNWRSIMIGRGRWEEEMEGEWGGGEGGIERGKEVEERKGGRYEWGEEADGRVRIRRGWEFYFFYF